MTAKFEEYFLFGFYMLEVVGNKGAGSDEGSSPANVKAELPFKTFITCFNRSHNKPELAQHMHFNS